MKENNLQPRLLYPVRISFRYEGEFKSFTDKQKLVERIQHHQTSSSTNAKGSSLDRKHRKVVWTRTQNNKANGNRTILINNYLKCKWAEFPNQKTKTGWTDTKARPLYMLSTRDQPQNKGHIQTESEGLEKKYSTQMETKRKQESQYSYQIK